MEIILIIISVVLWLVMLIKFFQLSSNVSEINEKMNPDSPNYWKRQYGKEIALGRSKEALFALQEYLWLRTRKEFYVNRKKVYGELKEKYQDKILELGGVFPDESIIDD